MDESLRYYLENTLVKLPAFSSRLTHPVTRLHYPPRAAYPLLQQYATEFFQAGTEPRFVSLAGLRGVGKTTLLWQVAHHIFREYHQEVYFFNVNTLKTLGISLQVALDAFQQHILRRRFQELSAPIALLFDEVQDDEQWSRTLKVLYDEARTAFILCTGSSALLLNTTADLSRRMYTQKIYPFSFSELIRAQELIDPAPAWVSPPAHLGPDLKEALFYSQDAKMAAERLESLRPAIEQVLMAAPHALRELQKKYINFLNLPNLLFFSDESIATHLLLDLLKRIVHEDIPALQPTFTDFTCTERLLLRLAGSDEVNPEKLAGLVGMKQPELLELMELLAKAELLNVLLPYGGLDTRIAKKKKAFFMSPALRKALLTTLYGEHLPAQFESKLREDLVVMYLKRVLPEGMVSFLTGSTEANPDFVIETREQPLLLEIGTGKTLARQFRGAGLAHRYGVLISDSAETAMLREGCIHLPLSWFLLL